ncbi:MAG TPA: DegT/DnrJ/EryC1/StrS family aminotransferase, partial [Thermoleophilaceae bacterium]|nr:DegT/DnrJ/EryC1/StrS family aminotransferase [Thermoleophilaceae bacterium]
LDRYQERLGRRLAEVAATGRYILGPEVAAFEEEFAGYCGASHCIGVANGTDAITISLRALGVGPGDEVVVPSFTFYASVEATVNAGATPVFCDVDPVTFCVTRETVERAVTDRTKAIVAVDLFGWLPPLDELRDLGLPILEDAAQAHGARRDGRRSGTFGDAATFSFFPSKNLGCLGDGGAIVTDDDEVAEVARRLRFHGSTDKVTYTEVGYNSRLDELQAGVLRELLPDLDSWNDARRAAALAYAERGLGDVPGIELPHFEDEREHVFHLYIVRHPDADALAAKLAEREIGARAYYRRPVHLQPAMERLGGERLDLPGTVEAARTHLALPMGTELSVDQVDEVIAACASGST